MCGVRRMTEARNPKRKSNVDPELVQNLEAVLELEAILEANPNPNLNLNQENESEAKPNLVPILDLVLSRDRAHIKDENLDPGTLFGLGLSAEFFLCWSSFGGHLFDHLSVGLYFSHHHTYYKSQFFHTLDLCGQLFHVAHLHLSF